VPCGIIPAGAESVAIQPDGKIGVGGTGPGRAPPRPHPNGETERLSTCVPVSSSFISPCRAATSFLFPLFFPNPTDRPLKSRR
jgi:hypothetical protein